MEVQLGEKRASTDKMNIFRLAADMLHLLSFIVMLYRMKTQRSCRGVSLKSQILFLVVFCCRYLVS